MINHVLFLSLVKQGVLYDDPWDESWKIVVLQKDSRSTWSSKLQDVSILEATLVNDVVYATCNMQNAIKVKIMGSIGLGGAGGGGCKCTCSSWSNSKGATLSQWLGGKWKLGEGGDSLWRMWHIVVSFSWNWYVLWLVSKIWCVMGWLSNHY